MKTERVVAMAAVGLAALLLASLGAGAGEITGRVECSETGEGIEGMTVLLFDVHVQSQRREPSEPPDASETAETDAEGAFAFEGLSSGRYSVIAEPRADYVRSAEDWHIEAELETGETEEGTLVFQPAGSVTGRVLNEDAEPQADAAVSLVFDVDRGRDRFYRRAWTSI